MSAGCLTFPVSASPALLSLRPICSTNVPGPRELQNLVVIDRLEQRKFAFLVVVPTYPDMIRMIHVDAMLSLRPFVAVAATAPRLDEQRRRHRTPPPAAPPSRSGLPAACADGAGSTRDRENRPRRLPRSRASISLAPSATRCPPGTSARRLGRRVGRRGARVHPLKAGGGTATTTARTTPRTRLRFLIDPSSVAWDGLAHIRARILYRGWTTTSGVHIIGELVSPAFSHH